MASAIRYMAVSACWWMTQLIQTGTLTPSLILTLAKRNACVTPGNGQWIYSSTAAYTDVYETYCILRKTRALALYRTFFWRCLTVVPIFHGTNCQECTVIHYLCEAWSQIVYTQHHWKIYIIFSVQCNQFLLKTTQHLSFNGQPDKSTQLSMVVWKKLRLAS